MATIAPTSGMSGGRLARIVLRSQPDHRLLGLFRDGSQEAFEEITRRYRAPLTAYAASIATRDRADDVVQDSFTRAYRHLGNGQGADVEQLKPWLYRVVRNTALNDVRDEGRHDHDQLDLNYDGVEQPPQAAERRAQVGALVAGLQGLPDAQRDALIKRELEGMGHEQIAADMGVSQGAVRQLIYRARNSLRDGMGMLIPTPLVRWLTESGGGEVAGASAAGAGVGAATLLKGGAAVGIVAAALFAGSELKQSIEAKPAHDAAERDAGARHHATAAAPGSARPGHGASGTSSSGSSGSKTGDHGSGSGQSGSGKGEGSHSSSGSGGGSHSGTGSGGGESHSGSGSDDGAHSGSGSGTGTSGGGDSHSGPGGGGDDGGTSGSGTSGSGSTESGSGSSGSGTSGSDDGISGSSGSGSSGSGSSGSSSSGSGSDDGVITTTTPSS